MPKKIKPWKPTTRRVLRGGEGPGGAVGSPAASWAGHRARDDPAGRGAVGLRGGHGPQVGQARRHQRGREAGSLVGGRGEDQGARGRERPRAAGPGTPSQKA